MDSLESFGKYDLLSNGVTNFNDFDRFFAILILKIEKIIRNAKL